MGANKITQATPTTFGTTLGGIFLRIFFTKFSKILQNFL
jgi:hypothetical protein